MAKKKKILILSESTINSVIGFLLFEIEIKCLVARKACVCDLGPLEIAQLCSKHLEKAFSTSLPEVLSKHT